MFYGTNRMSQYGLVVFNAEEKRDFFPKGAKWKFPYPSKLQSVCLIL